MWLRRVGDALGQAQFDLVTSLTMTAVGLRLTVGFSGDARAERAVASGRKLAFKVANDPDLGDSFPVGVGVHTGVAYVGVVGEIGSLDFTVLGDTANTAARPGDAALGVNS